MPNRLEVICSQISLSVIIIYTCKCSQEFPKYKEGFSCTRSLYCQNLSHDYYPSYLYVSWGHHSDSPVQNSGRSQPLSSLALRHTVAAGIIWQVSLSQQVPIKFKAKLNSNWNKIVIKLLKYRSLTYMHCNTKCHYCEQANIVRSYVPVINIATTPNLSKSKWNPVHHSHTNYVFQKLLTCVHILLLSRMICSQPNSLGAADRKSVV